MVEVAGPSEHTMVCLKFEFRSILIYSSEIQCTVLYHMLSYQNKWPNIWYSNPITFSNTHKLILYNAIRIFKIDCGPPLMQWQSSLHASAKLELDWHNYTIHTKKYSLSCSRILSIKVLTHSDDLTVMVWTFSHDSTKMVYIC